MQGANSVHVTLGAEWPLSVIKIAHLDANFTFEVATTSIFSTTEANIRHSHIAGRLWKWLLVCPHTQSSGRLKRRAGIRQEETQ